MAKILLFDIDNTLLDYTGAERQAFLALKNRYCPDCEEGKFKSIWLKNTKKFWNEYEKGIMSFAEQQEARIAGVWSALNLPLREGEERKIFDEYLSIFENSWSPFSGLSNWLGSLNLPKGILSNGNGAQQKSKLKKIGLLDHFSNDLIFTAEEVGLFKPDPSLFNYVETVSGFSGEEILYIGDKPNIDVHPALDFGWRSLLLDWHGLYLDRVLDCPTARSIEELNSFVLSL